MHWSKRFRDPIVLKDGRTVTNLNQARELIVQMSRSRSQRVRWDDTVDAVYDAAHLLHRSSVDLARESLELALKADGLI
jgi:hypothetical protein